MPYTDDQIRQKAYELEKAGAPSSAIQQFVSTAVAERGGGFQQSGGLLGTAANTINQAYRAYTQLPGVKQASETVGRAVGVAGKAIGGGVGFLGGLLTGQNPIETAGRTAEATGQFGQDIGTAGAAAAPLAGVGRVPAALLGFGQSYQGVQDIKQGIQNRDVAQGFQGALELGTGIAAGIGAFRPGLGLLGSTPREPLFKNSANPEVFGALERQGINPREVPVADLSRNRLVQLGESSVAKGPLGEPVIERAQQYRQTLQGVANRIVEQLRPEEALDRQALGELVQRGPRQLEETFDAQKNQLYDNFLADKNPVVLSPDALQGVMRASQEAQTAILENPSPSATRAASELSALVNNLAGGRGGEGYQPTLNNLRLAKLAVGELAGETARGGPTGKLAAGSILEVKKAIDRSLHDELNKIDPEAGAQLDQIDAYFKETKTRLSDETFRRVIGSDPEKVYAKYVKPNNVTELKNLRELVGDQHFNEFSKTFVEELLQNSYDKEGNFNVQKFESNLSRWDDPTLNELLAPEQQAKLKELKDTVVADYKVLKQANKASARLTEGSQTAFLGRTMRLGGELALAVGSILRGDFATAAKIIATETLVEGGAAKLYTTDKGVDFLLGHRPRARMSLIPQPIQRAASLVPRAILPAGEANLQLNR